MASPLTNPHAGAPWTRLNVNCGTDLFNFLFRGIFVGVNRHTPLVNTLLQVFADELKRNNLSASFDSEPAAVAILGRISFADTAGANQLLHDELARRTRECSELESKVRDLKRKLAAVDQTFAGVAAPLAPVHPRKPTTRRKHVGGGTPKVRRRTPSDGEQPDDANGKA